MMKDMDRATQIKAMASPPRMKILRLLAAPGRHFGHQQSADPVEFGVCMTLLAEALTVTQPTKRPELLFYQAKVYMDEELNVPIRYVAYDWPKPNQQKLDVIEEYNYLNLKLNVGLTDADFDPNNSSYNFY